MMLIIDFLLTFRPEYIVHLTFILIYAIGSGEASFLFDKEKAVKKIEESKEEPKEEPVERTVTKSFYTTDTYRMVTCKFNGCNVPQLTEVGDYEALNLI